MVHKKMKDSGGEKTQVSSEYVSLFVPFQNLLHRNPLLQLIVIMLSLIITAQGTTLDAIWLIIPWTSASFSSMASVEAV